MKIYFYRVKSIFNGFDTSSPKSRLQPFLSALHLHHKMWSRHLKQNINASYWYDPYKWLHLFRFRCLLKQQPTFPFSYQYPPQQYHDSAMSKGWYFRWYTDINMLTSNDPIEPNSQFPAFTLDTFSRDQSYILWY